MQHFWGEFTSLPPHSFSSTKSSKFHKWPQFFLTSVMGDLKRYFTTNLFLLWAVSADSCETNRENTPSHKTQVFTKSMNINIWVLGTLNHFFIRGSYTEIKFFKKMRKKTLLFVKGLFCTPYSISVDIAFYMEMPHFQL